MCVRAPLNRKCYFENDGLFSDLIKFARPVLMIKRACWLHCFRNASTTIHNNKLFRVARVFRYGFYMSWEYIEYQRHGAQMENAHLIQRWFVVALKQKSFYHKICFSASIFYSRRHSIWVKRISMNCFFLFVCRAFESSDFNSHSSFSFTILATAKNWMR